MVLAVAGLYAYHAYNRRVISLSEVEADMHVGAVALVHEFLANDSAAYHKYRNKVLSVEGMVREVDTTGGDCTVVMGDSVALSSAVRCLLDSTQASKAGALRRGDLVKIKGALTGFKKDETGLLGSDVELNRCVVDQP